MSILGRVADPQNAQGAQLLTLAVLTGLGLLAVGVAVFAGVFRRRSIVGPPRVAEAESLGTIVVILGMGVILLIMTQALCLMPPASGAATTAPASRPASPSLLEDIPKMALISSVPPIITFFFFVVASRALRPDGLRCLGLSAGQFKTGLLSGLAGSVIMVPLVFVASEATELIWRAVHYVHPSEHELLRGLGESKSSGIATVLILSAVLVAPLFEETLFRGHLQTLFTYMWVRLRRGARRVIPVTTPLHAASQEQGAAIPLSYEPVSRIEPQPWMRWLSIAVTSVLFSALHPAWSIPPIFILSLCLGYAYERTGNLWTTITMHSTFNATSTLLFMLMMR